jgi:hypothetical protein
MRKGDLPPWAEARRQAWLNRARLAREEMRKALDEQTGSTG